MFAFEQSERLLARESDALGSVVKDGSAPNEHLLAVLDVNQVHEPQSRF